MLHFLKTIEKDVSKAAKKTAKVGKNTLHFLGDAAEDTGKGILKVANSGANPVTAVDNNVVAPLVHHIGALGSSVSDIAKGAVDSATGNKEAVANINKKKAKDFSDALSAPARAVAQAAETIRHPLSKHTVTPQSESDKEIFGKEPIQNINAAVANNYDQHKNLNPAARVGLALLYGGGQVAQDAATLAGGKKVGGEVVSDAGKAVAKTTKSVSKIADDVASKTSGLKAHQVVNDNEAGTLSDLADTKTLDKNGKPLYNPDIKTLNQLNKQARNAAQTAGIDITSGSNMDIKNRIADYLEARDNHVNTRQAVAQGGYVGNGGTKNKAVAALTGEDSHTTQQLDDLEAAGANQVKPTVQRAKEALTSPTKPGYEAPKSGAEVLNDVLPNSAKLDSSVVQMLEKTGKVVPKASKAPILDNFIDPQAAASKYLGKTGSDIVYDSSEAAKKQSDIKQGASGYLKEMDKQLKSISKNKAVQSDVESRIHDALSDRSNADSYLKSDKEKKLYNSTKDLYDYVEGHIKGAGKGTLENYAPNTRVRDAQNAADGLDYTLNKAFSNSVDAPNLKQRVESDDNTPLRKTPVSDAAGYVSSVSKQLAYEDLMKSLPERLQNVDARFGVNHADLTRGRNFLQKHFQNLLQPDIPTDGFFGEKFQNKLINQSYRSALKGKASFYLQNPTQILAARSQVSKDAIKLVGNKASRVTNAENHIDPEDLRNLQKGLTSGKSTVSSDLGGSDTATQSKTDVLSEKLSGEQRNVTQAFNLGASQQIVNSPIYKAAVKSGKTARQAAKDALADPATREHATRDGNVLVNTTQFGANIANKPHVLSEGGTLGPIPLSKKWAQQYKRFQLGTTQLLGNMTNPTQARALDIMRRGDPKQTQLVDYLSAAQTLRKGMKDAKSAVKQGAGNDVTTEDLERSKALLDKSIKVLKKQIKNNSAIRGTRTAKNLGLMWAASSTIQFLFDGAVNPAKAIKYGAPVSPPSKSNNNPLTVSVPSAPVSQYSKAPLGLSASKLLNFVPIVGPIANREKEAANFVKALTGNNK